MLNEQLGILTQLGSYGSWKTRKVMGFYKFVFKTWNVKGF